MAKTSKLDKETGTSIKRILSSYTKNEVSSHTYTHTHPKQINKHGEALNAYC